MARVHLILGPVGAGKSTFAIQLCRDHRAVRLTLDEWMAVLFRPDRPDSGLVEWYVERAQRCIDQIWRVTTNIIETGTDVVLEIGLILRRDRVRFYQRVDATTFGLAIHVLDAPRDERWERVQRRNQERGETFSMVVPADIFELASDMWEAPDDEECHGRDVRFVAVDGTRR